MMTVEEAITGRRCIRAFLPKPVPRELVERVLLIAGRAPSGSNVQPWKVWVMDGPCWMRSARSWRTATTAARSASASTIITPRNGASPTSPAAAPAAGASTARSASAARTRTKMHAQHRRNFLFFDAPVGLMFSIDRDLEQGSWLDYGMFLQNIMIAARQFGLETCPQAAFLIFYDVLQKRLRIPAEQTIVCGMAFGYPDPSGQGEHVCAGSDGGGGVCDVGGECGGGVAELGGTGRK